MSETSRLPARIRALPKQDGREFDVHRLRADGCDVLFVSAPSGAECPPHSHDSDNVTVIVAGKTVVTTDGTEQHCGPGDWYQSAPGEVHAIRFDADTVQIELRFDQPA